LSVSEAASLEEVARDIRVEEPAAAASPAEGCPPESALAPSSERLPWLLVFGSVVLAAWLASDPGARTIDCTLATLGFLALVPAQLAMQATQRWLRDEKPAATPLKPSSGKQPLQTENGEAEAVARVLAQLGDLASCPGSGVSEAACRRFLRGWKGDVDGAASGIRKYVEWRKETRPGDITADDVKRELATGKGYPHGLDRCGRAVMWAFAGRHNKNTRDIEETVQLILYSLERAIKTGEEHGVEQVCLVFDLSGFGTKNMDYEAVKRLFMLLANYYPERLGQVLLLNAPGVFNVFWRVIRPYIDPVTFKKIQFVSKGALSDFIEPALLPPEVINMLER